MGQVRHDGVRNRGDKVAVYFRRNEEEQPLGSCVPAIQVVGKQPGLFWLLQKTWTLKFTNEME